MNTKSIHGHYVPRRSKNCRQRDGHQQHVDPYPLLGIALLLLTAVLAYGATYFLFFD